MILRQNSVARTVDAYRNFGCAILTTIVVMTQMNQHTCAVKEIVQLDGRDVQVSPTIVAFPNGSSVTVKTIVETTAMNSQKTVPNANPKLTSSARTIVAFLNNGLVTLLMTVVTVPMNLRLSAKESIESALSLSSAATMENVFQADGDVVSFQQMLFANIF